MMISRTPRVSVPEHTSSVGMLVIVRGGQSEADAHDVFAGLLDPPLTEAGRQEARSVARLLADADLVPDLTVTSPFARGVQMTQAIHHALGLGETAPTVSSWRLAARDVGALTGMPKSEALARYGKGSYLSWRYSLDAAPPPCDVQSTQQLPWAPSPALVKNLPWGQGESLRAVIGRMRPLWQETIWPALGSGRNVLVVSHADPLRALRAIACQASDEEAPALHVVPAQPMLIVLDRDGRQVIAEYVEDAAAPSR